MTDSAALKHQLGLASITRIADVLMAAWPEFDNAGFRQQAGEGLEQLELKARVAHIVSALADFMPRDFVQAAAILKTVAAIWPENKLQQNWAAFSAWPLIDYVQHYGLEQPELAFDVLAKLTPLFTAEFAIRPFLQTHFELTHQQMLRWSRHHNEHVRRLASEGIRPRLPWAAHLQCLRQDPSPIWPILENMKDDPSLYVRRSVANNLNDISKDHPQLVLDRCRSWQQQANAHIDWVIRHGLRTLVKTGYPGVYPLLGFDAEPELARIAFKLEQATIQLGQTQTLKLELEAGTRPQQLVVDYRVVFVSANESSSSKVFKWKNIKLPAGGKLRLEKKHAFKPISTRRYYPGKHLVEVVINGKVFARAGFELTLE